MFLINSILRFVFKAKKTRIQLRIRVLQYTN